MNQQYKHRRLWRLAIASYVSLVSLYKNKKVPDGIFFRPAHSLLYVLVNVNVILQDSFRTRP